VHAATSYLNMHDQLAALLTVMMIVKITRVIINTRNIIKDDDE
jgi:cytochrome b